MRMLRNAVSLVLVGAGLAVIPMAPIDAAPGDPPIVERMRDEAAGKVTVRNSPATDRVGFVRATDDLMPSRQRSKSATGAADKAKAFVAKYGAAFGGSGVELTQSAVTETPAGHTVDFVQTHRGLPVFGSKLRAHVDRQGDLTSVGGFVSPRIDVDTTPRLDEDAAVSRAKQLVAARPAGSKRSPSAKVGKLTVTKADLSVYRMGAIQGVAGDNVLAWVIEVTDGKQVRETVVLDALTGKPVNRYSMIAHALDRELYEESIDSTPVWTEGDDFPAGLDEDQQNEVLGAGESYWFFRNSFDRDSYDGAGAKMITVNNDPSINCPNANWNGTSTNYCTGVTSDDTVAHEWGHAYTEYTSGLLYQWQPGAMNEAYSDIWGETVDMLNDRHNESPNTAREVGDCSTHSLGIAISIVAPEEIAGDCMAVKASGGPPFPSDPTEVDLVVGLDAEDAAANDLPTDGCSPFTNAAEIAGNWVYVDENLATACGAGGFEEYYEGLNDNAVAAGATGIIVGGDPEFDPWDMPGATFTIPAAQVDGDSGAAIKSVPGPVTISVGPAEFDGPQSDSYRWLSGEGDPAFGGAIRDMWNPTCYGDPGKVSDEEYHCETSDNGGVHSNSGVVNHTYALLVDGGTDNGVEVPGIGLDKAAHIFWRTQTEYLTPVSGFGELADGLEASCADLTGLTTLKQLAVGVSDTGGAETDGGALEPITADDCAAVAAAASATELRVEPDQCNFQPMFKKGTIGCGDGTVDTKTWTETFESGVPADWTQDVVEYGPGGQTHFDPVVTDDLPVVSEGGTAHKGGPGVLYFNDRGNAGNFGSCAGDENDYSSRVGMITPELTVPDGELPRFSFDHYVATEVGWDGGNVKVSVNGGGFELVPAAAWLHNGPGAELEPAPDNTNPMEGQPAFTGTDGGLPTGAWGTSVIDLSALAAAGDSLKFRFDFGMDGCNGNDGWYIDNVTVSSCTVPVVTPPPPGTAVVYPTANAKKGKVKITIVGVAPKHQVTVKIKGRTYRAPAVRNVVKVKAKKQLRKLWKRGVRKVNARVSYPGDAGVKPFSGKVKITLKGRQ